MLEILELRGRPLENDEDKVEYLIRESVKRTGSEMPEGHYAEVQRNILVFVDKETSLITHKMCALCCEVKSFDDFHRQRKCSNILNGYHNKCKLCRNEERQRIYKRKQVRQAIIKVSKTRKHIRDRENRKNN